MSDLAKLRRFGAILTPGSVIRSVMDEILPLTAKVSSWTQIPTSGNVVVRYNTATGRPAQYDVKYQQGNIGNLVHEMIHVAVNEAYGQDFVNYPNRNAQNVPAPQYTPQGYRQNEFERQTAYMNPALNARMTSNLMSIKGWANASQELSPEQRTQIASACDYGVLWPHREHDTVMTQILVWLIEWGYPVANAPAARKPVVNALFEEVEKIVRQAYLSRRAGA